MTAGSTDFLVVETPLGEVCFGILRIEGEVSLDGLVIVCCAMTGVSSSSFSLFIEMLYGENCAVPLDGSFLQAND